MNVIKKSFLVLVFSIRIWYLAYSTDRSFDVKNRLPEVKIQWSEEENLLIASDFKYYVIVLGRQRKIWQTSLSYFASGSSISLSSWFIGFKAD